MIRIGGAVLSDGPVWSRRVAGGAGAKLPSGGAITVLGMSSPCGGRGASDVAPPRCEASPRSAAAISAAVVKRRSGLGAIAR